MIASIVLLAAFQDVPTEIPAKELPKAAECVICSAGGAGHGMEKPAAGVRYKGKSYYFCNKGEVKTFMEDPEGYLPPVLPRPMPILDLPDTMGKRWDAEAFKGKVVLLDWWATWCGPCKELMPTVEKLREKHLAKGFEVLSVSIDEKRSELDKYLGKKKFANPVLWDDQKRWNDYKIKSIPALFLIKDGQVVAQWTGKPKFQDLDAAVAKALQ